ncbi:MAG: D-alanyl-D-alanine carboxypeptidase/D-alanyl-D-alanine-endopeptidase [Phycisphaerales bacterium]|nr:D-alanyl-D-alanine carboxypeptidase/D-alanyl-D-alanine-endopeptidase [Phycisphaerales bacterium]
MHSQVKDIRPGMAKALHQTTSALTSSTMNRQQPHFRTFLIRVLAGMTFIVGLGVISLAGQYAAADEIERAKKASLKSQLDAILPLPKSAKARLGAHIIELDTGSVLYDRDSKRPLIPASNMKLVVMAAAIHQLGPDYKYQTVLAIRDTDLIVIGSGDPTFGDERLAEARDETITAVFHKWAQILKDAGIRQIPGNILVDDLIFDLKFTHPKWPSDQYQSWYEAPIGGLNFNANCVQTVVIPTQPKKPAEVHLVPGNSFLKVSNKTTTGKKSTVVVARPRGSDTLIVRGSVSKKGKLKEVTVREPGLYFGSVLKTVLATEGIPVGGKVVREKVRLKNGHLPKNCHILDVHRTPVGDALARCGKDSLGMMAEGLLKTLGAHQSGLGSWESGRSAIHAFLRTVNVPADQVTVDDGSGLSRYNRLSASAATRILRFMHDGPEQSFELFKSSLAVAGIDGTLKKRLRSKQTKGRIFGKTGYINGVWSLSGYVHTHSDHWLAFALYYNATGKTSTPKPRIDRACRLLVQWPNLPATSQMGD